MQKMRHPSLHTQLWTLFMTVTWMLLSAFSGIASSSQLLSVHNPAVPASASANGNSVAPQITPDGRFVLFTSLASDLVSNRNGIFALNLFLRDRASNTTALVSMNLDGTGGGNASSMSGQVSTNGRYVVFQSDASDLVPGDTNGVSDIFLRDLVAGTTTLISAATNGGVANGASTDAVMTPDGRFVAFISAATNLVANDTNGITDVFVRDVVNNATTLVSVGATGTNTVMATPVIAPDGSRVVFFSTATNLVPGVSTFSKGEIYLRDLAVNKTVWASTNAANVVSNFLRLTFMPSYHPALSDDGNLVTFKCGWTNGLVAPTSPGVKKSVIFQFNVATETSTWFTTNAFPQWPYGDDVFGPEATPNGRFVAFVATNAAPTNSLSVQVWDTQTGSNLLASAAMNGAFPTNSFSVAPCLSPDGRFVAFLSNATNLVANVVSNGYHLYLYDLQLQATQLVDANTNGIGAMDEWGAAPFFSATGQFIAFGSVDGSLVSGDANNAHDVFVRDTVGGTTELISQATLLMPAASGNLASMLGAYSISADGRWAVFSSSASDLVTNDFNNDRDVFIADLQNGTNALVSVGLDGNSASGGTSFSPVISADGHFAAFASSATNLVAGDTNRAADIFLRDLQAGVTTWVSVNSSGNSLGSGDASAPVLSEEGRYVAFLMKTNVSVVYPSTFWRDTVAGTTMLLAGASSNGPSMSADGNRVAFFDSASRLYVWDASLAANIYTNAALITSAVISPSGSRLLYHNQTAKQLVVLDLSSNSILFTCTNGTPIKSGSPWSSDGRWVAFVTGAVIVPGDSNGTNDVFLCDLQTGTTTLLSLNQNGTGSAGGISDSPVISGDGRFVAFRSFATNVISGITNVPSLFLFDRTTGSNTVLATGSSGSWTFWVSPPVLSSNGNAVAFQSWDAGVISGDANRASDAFAQTQNVLIADSDGDGIPDWWMLNYFGHATGQAGDGSRATDDADGDGMSNLQEYIAGTNPTDAASVFRLQIASSVSPTPSVKLNWATVPGRNYQVQMKTNLTDAVWQSPPGGAAVVGSQGSFTVQFYSAQPGGFYRIVVENN